MDRPTCTVICLAERRREREQTRRQARRYFLLALVPQRLALAALILYGILRLLLAPEVPFSYYTGPLWALWPLAFLFLLVSYISDCVLWWEP